MPTTTPNYGLVKPNPDEFYNVQVNNNNLDKIDSELKLIEEKAGEVDLSGLATKQELQTVSNALATHSADYMYQIPTIVGAQIRINRLSDTNRLFFKLDADLTGDITISTDGGTTEKPLVDVDENQITQLEKGFVEVVADANFFILRNRGISGADKQALIDIVNEAEANESDLKAQFIDTVNDRTGSTLPVDATWFDIKNTISNMSNVQTFSGIRILSKSERMARKFTFEELPFTPRAIMMTLIHPQTISPQQVITGSKDDSLDDIMMNTTSVLYMDIVWGLDNITLSYQGTPFYLWADMEYKYIIIE